MSSPPYGDCCPYCGWPTKGGTNTVLMGVKRPILTAAHPVNKTEFIHQKFLKISPSPKNKGLMKDDKGAVFFQKFASGCCPPCILREHPFQSEFAKPLLSKNLNLLGTFEPFSASNQEVPTSPPSTKFPTPMAPEIPQGMFNCILVIGKGTNPQDFSSDPKVGPTLIGGSPLTSENRAPTLGHLYLWHGCLLFCSTKISHTYI